ncbi:MAG TPA: maleylpyruvate isomerase family mycothiol-dependent enzyme [Jatrophihabitans sp.]|nr:maleylpyruvate isomerase family mycothiol-dependent enzyme [Jatrophihabitans sp.]
MHTLRVVATALAMLAAMGICATLGRRQRAATVALVLLSLVWLTLDSDFEGPILIKLTKNNSVTLADLVAVAGILVAAGLWRRTSRRPTSPPGPGAAGAGAQPGPRACDDLSMPEPTAALHALRASTADLLNALQGVQWSDADLTEASLCPGWTRGHVLTHLARNADGITATVAGALRGEIVPRYPDGWDARNADIDAGAGRPLNVQVADLRDSAERLDRVFGAVTEADGWQLPTAEDKDAEHWVFARLREVEIHRVDLDHGYTPDRWPPLMVTRLLPDAADTLGKRTSEPLRVEVTEQGSLAPDCVGKSWTAGEGDGDPTVVRGPDWAVLAWLVGRGSAARDALGETPELGPWR